MYPMVGGLSSVLSNGGCRSVDSGVLANHILSKRFVPLRLATIWRVGRSATLVQCALVASGTGQPRLAAGSVDPLARDAMAR